MGVRPRSGCGGKGQLAGERFVKVTLVTQANLLIYKYIMRLRMSLALVTIWLPVTKIPLRGPPPHPMGAKRARFYGFGLGRPSDDHTPQQGATAVSHAVAPAIATELSSLLWVRYPDTAMICRLFQSRACGRWGSSRLKQQRSSSNSATSSRTSASICGGSRTAARGRGLDARPAASGHGRCGCISTTSFAPAVAGGAEFSRAHGR